MVTCCHVDLCGSLPSRYGGRACFGFGHRKREAAAGRSPQFHLSERGTGWNRCWIRPEPLDRWLRSEGKRRSYSAEWPAHCAWFERSRAWAPSQSEADSFRTTIHSAPGIWIQCFEWPRCVERSWSSLRRKIWRDFPKDLLHGHCLWKWKLPKVRSTSSGCSTFESKAMARSATGTL